MAILMYLLSGIDRPMSANVNIKFIELGDPENIGTAVGYSCLLYATRLQTRVLPVWRPYLIYGKEFNFRFYNPFVSDKFLR
jgi:hypothetical protein